MEKQDKRTVVGVRMSVEERRLIKMVCACTSETQAEMLNRLVKDELGRMEKSSSIPTVHLVKITSSGSRE